MQMDFRVQTCQNGEQVADTQTNDPILLAQQALAKLEKLNRALDDPQAYWLLGMIDVLRVYVDQLTEIPNRMFTVHCSDGVILRRGLQSFVVAEAEFPEVRNAFRRSKHYQKRKNEMKDRRTLTST